MKAYLSPEWELFRLKQLIMTVSTEADYDEGNGDDVPSWDDALQENGTEDDAN